MNNFGEKMSFIWSVADLLRGPYKPAQYGKVILPLTVLRHLDCDLVLKKSAKNLCNPRCALVHLGQFRQAVGDTLMGPATTGTNQNSH